MKVLSIAASSDSEHASDVVTNEELGQAIVAALARAGVSKSELARQTGRTWPTIHAWCIGKHRPSKGDLAVIATVTRTDVVELQGADGETSPEPPYAAWAEFTQTAEFKMGEPWMVNALRAMRVPAGKQPTLETYKRLMFAQLSIEGESDD